MRRTQRLVRHRFYHAYLRNTLQGGRWARKRLLHAAGYVTVNWRTYDVTPESTLNGCSSEECRSCVLWLIWELMPPTSSCTCPDPTGPLYPAKRWRVSKVLKVILSSYWWAASAGNIRCQTLKLDSLKPWSLNIRLDVYILHAPSPKCTWRRAMTRDHT